MGGGGGSPLPRPFESTLLIRTRPSGALQVHTTTARRLGRLGRLAPRLLRHKRRKRGILGREVRNFEWVRRGRHLKGRWMRHQICIRERPTWYQVGLQIHLEVEGVVVGVMHEPMRVRGPKLLCGCPCESRALRHTVQEELGVQIGCC